MKAYQDILASVPGVSDWTIRRSRSTEHQRYLLKDRPECERTVERTRLTVTVINRHDKGQGQASFTLFGEDAPLPRSKVDDAVFMASLQSNPPYSLPAPAPMPAVDLRDSELKSNVRGALDAIQDRVFTAIGREKAARLSAAEVFLNRGETEIRTSTGVEAAKEETSLYLELVVLARDGEQEAESVGEYSARRLASLNIEEIVARHTRFARDTMKAELPSTRTGPAVLSGDTFIPLLEPFKFATSGDALYRKLSPLAVGRTVFGDRTISGDVLTLTSDATLAFGGQSTPFDEEGLALGPIQIINGGSFNAAAASQQYAEYLGVQATGDWHNAVLNPGPKSLDGLLEPAEEPVLHVVKFSFLNPDNVRGAFSTEIRLGYEISRTGTRVIKGGSVAGNVYDAFAAAHFARETALRDDYFGPVAIRFDALQVAGKS